MLASSEVPRVDARIPSTSPNETAVAPFELSAGPYESPALAVLSFRGREAISRAFSFEITVAASPEVDSATIEPDLLGRPACLTMQAGASAPRLVRGVVAAVSALSVAHGGRGVYRLRIVPALWVLKKRTTSRIFQDKTVPEIVAAVLDGAGVSYALCLIGKYRPRTYCVQHRETDFAFVERLLAEEGIFYTFDHGGPDAKTETVALSDSARLYPAIDGDAALAYRPHDGVAGMALGERHVQRFELGRSLRPTSVFRRGYDFRRPALALEAEGKLSDLGGGEPTRAEVYEHHEEDEEPNVRQETVTAELEQHRANVEVGHGESGCRRLVPGARFTLCDHDLGRLDREYVVTDIKHTGWDPQAAAQGQAVYANTFECVPATVAARPRRPARALQQVTETALVVGPEGQEIYTDEYGRVKVQFHWDREGRRDERSSCWIRVSQAWAGSGWGFEFLPRVGMEVVVTFLGGDVDRPLITGCVPNAINKPPFRLPEHKTQSGIRTQSTPGGDGFNELMFEDLKGLEQINLGCRHRFASVSAAEFC
jgi:type VI secretion system secreted protein VgrG